MFDNAVDVVELLLAPTDQVPNVRHLCIQHTFSSMTSSAFLIQQDGEVVDEFRQHGGVVMVMVKSYLRRDSPKHYENITGSVNGGGGRRTRLSNCSGCARRLPPT